jgi:hypothetical protein
MLRADVILALQDYLAATYDGPVSIHREEDDVQIEPPYAVIRVGSADAMNADQVDLWTMSVMVGVFHDADNTTATTAEDQAGAVFAALDDIDSMDDARLVISAWFRTATEASKNETNWQHIAGWEMIVAPPAPAAEE